MSAPKKKFKRPPEPLPAPKADDVTEPTEPDAGSDEHDEQAEGK